MIETFDEYQDKAGESDFVGDSMTLLYYALGLAGESSEISEKVAAILFGHTKYSASVTRDIALELGDVCWYVARFSANIHMKLSDVIGNERVQRYQQEIVFEDNTPIGDTLRNFSIKIGIYSGMICDIAKKALRDNDGYFNPTHVEDIRALLSQTMKYVALLAANISYPLSQVMQMNYDKLCDRYKRGTIGGSGDHR